MGIYVILDIDVHNSEKYREYQRRVPAIIQKYGGRYLVRGGNITILGEWKPERIVILEFPSFDNLLEFVNSPEYQPVKRIREEAATSRMIAVEGCDEDFPAI